MSESVDTPAEGIDNELRSEIFLYLVDTAEAQTPSGIADGVGTTRQQVKYHLDKLVNSGLVVADRGEYYCQPLFIDSDFGDIIEGALADIAPEAAQRVYMPERLDASEKEVVLFNCLKMALSLSLFSDEVVEEPVGDGAGS